MKRFLNWLAYAYPYLMVGASLAFILPIGGWGAFTGIMLGLIGNGVIIWRNGDK